MSKEVASVVIRSLDNRFLLLQRSPFKRRPFLWDLPGGKIDKGEKPIKAALRELHEETGIWIENPNDLIVLPTQTFKLDDGEVKYHLYTTTFGTTHCNHVKLERQFIGFGWFTQSQIVAMNIWKMTMRQVRYAVDDAVAII